MTPFDIRNPLPTGTTVLEASAGTGKTYTVAALVTRYVAEGHTTIERMLVVTFGRVASQELRERVREQLVTVERGLADPAAARSSADDQLLQLLAEAADAEVARRRRRVATALAHFDTATIATTHQFCQQVLIGLGVAGDSEPGSTLVENLDELVVEVVDDLYVRGFARPGADEPIFSRAGALQLGRDAVRDPQARLEPTDAEPGSPADIRRRFAHAVRLEVDRRKRSRGLLGYDDLLSRLAGALEPADAAARDRMRSRWSVVLVDEFQDTDPVQWDVLRLAFAGHATLILIGDPKQAIYAFRGGDVFTYLAAARTAGTKSTLADNWRSDAPLVAALESLMGGAELGDPEIVVRPVRATHDGSRLIGAPSPAPLRLRVVRRDQVGVGPRSKIDMRTVRALVARDLAGDIAALLAAHPAFDKKPLVAGDVAVLVGTHDQSALVREALAAVGVPSVIAGAGSVYATPAGEDWLVLLEALEQPHRSGRVRAAALTPFLGRTATELGTGGEDLTDELGATLRGWARVLTERGVAALLEVAVIDQQLPARLLAQQDGGRRLTDLRHVGQGLQAVAVQEGLGLPALVEWLRGRRDEAAADLATDRIRRLDSDAAAVQVVTLHASKGLQFPVVYLPFAFDRWVPKPDVLLLHDDNGHRVLDVGGQASTGRVDRQRRAATEQAGEALRLLYVGLTRAQSQVVTWWAPSSNTPDSGLHRLLFGRGLGAADVPEQARIPSDDQAATVLAALAARGGPTIEAAIPAAAPPVLAVDEAADVLIAQRFSRVLDTAWRRTSYSALAAAGEQSHAGVSSEPEDGERDDEALDADVKTAGGDAALLAIPSPMADLPAGTSFGTLVHAILETTDPTAPDLLAELHLRSTEQLARRPAGIGAEQLAGALLATLSTPLGPIADGLALRDLSASDRLAELDFELPLAGGDRPDGHQRVENGSDSLAFGRPDSDITLGDVGDLLRTRLHPGDPLAGYARRLSSPGMSRQSLRGYLTGSLDAVFRLPGPRYVVADYKTNWLGEFGVGLGEAGPRLSAWHYRPEALDEAMAGSDYPLQALLYCVALHRFLRWRQPGYDPERHLGGVLYLFVRGMCGVANPEVDGRPCGVFGWQPPADLVVDLSALLDAKPAGSS
jgi:exodeoxyribonuclease V beta subunit